MKLSLSSCPAIARRRWATLLLVGIVLLRGLIPAGFMPDLAAGDGSLQLVICTGGGLKVVTVASAVAGGEQETPVSVSDDCAFGWLPGAVPLPVGQSVLWTLLAYGGAYDVRPALRHNGKADVPALGARAPPRSA